MKVIINDEGYFLTKELKNQLQVKTEEIIANSVFRDESKYTTEITFDKLGEASFEVKIDIMQENSSAFHASHTTTSDETLENGIKKLLDITSIQLEKLAHIKKMVVIVTGSNFRLGPKRNLSFQNPTSTPEENDDYIESPLKEYAVAKLTHFGEKYNKDGENKIHKLHAVFCKNFNEGFEVKIDITDEIELGNSVYHSSSSHADPYTAFDGALKRLKTQIEEQLAKNNSHSTTKPNAPILEDALIEAEYEVLGEDEENLIEIPNN